MISTFKRKVRKSFKVLSGQVHHLRETAAVPKKWYGNQYGGFYVAPSFLNDQSIVYSFGIGEDISFDETVIKNHHAAVFGFDPTPRVIDWIRQRAAAIPPRFKFLDYGIGVESGAKEFFLPKNREHVSGSFTAQANVDRDRSVVLNMKTFGEIVAELQHTKVDVLKMDIEGTEYEVLDSILQSSVKISQLLVEFHDRMFEDGHAKTRRAIQCLRNHGYEIFGVSDTFEEISFIDTSIL